jgi:2-C-methyl-D-erythritol 4-phosphate cytidylyltransferase/2-C-methyl-D-erythritol 2,4-cyclodiphosphate synthase
METSATNLDYKSFHLIIPASGSGQRMKNATLPKQYIKIHGKPILRHTIDRFLNFKNLKSITVIINPEHLDLYHDAVKGLNLRDPVMGGESRSHSVYNGLLSIADIANNDNVLIHDSVRPFFEYNQVETLLHSLQEYKAATLGIKVVDTLRRIDETSDNVIDRNNLWAIQTPQGFHFDVILDAFRKADDLSIYTDETSLIKQYGIKCNIVNSSVKNIKITTCNDLEIARSMLEFKDMECETRSAMGYDVHAFSTSGEKVILCGVEIPHTHSLKGHSDADVALHALTDAMLGAICSGDIGIHFPPSDNKWKNADSSIFVDHALALLQDKNAVLKFIDIR